MRMYFRLWGNNVGESVSESVNLWVRPGYMSRNLENTLQSIKYCLQPWYIVVYDYRVLAHTVHILINEQYIIL